MTPHFPEEQLILALLGAVPDPEMTRIDAHLATCDVCAQVAASSRRILEALRVPQPPPAARQRVADRLRQRVRLRRFLDRLLTDPTWQAEVRRNPRSALEQYQIHPSPQLVAALQEMEDLPTEHDGSQIDERISKLWLLGF